ncbi:E3 ubiquitin-protein ligase TRIM11-like [Hyperolius riggenbachi]|uniref:E3 ubiquitin-protein ligase TRIM11-like n=1 Tax=Hyperolius riggenbachi TaxID=752182 RepID=UPI0035A292A7
MASAGLREELKCSVCLKMYTDPVTLRCGHNFCRGCIHYVLDTQEGSGGYSCPECREKFPERPALQRNITLCNIVENLFVYLMPPKQNGFGVFCSHCIYASVPAVKSCLLCEVSLCEDHLKVHKQSPEHVLCDPTATLEDRKCSIHKKILEYFCTVDNSCICVSCTLSGKHRGHQVETLEEASEREKKKLRNALQKLMTQTEETKKRVQSLEELKRNAQEELDDETKRVTALFGDLRRRLNDLEKRALSNIAKRAKQDLQTYSDIIQQLEIKKDKISRKVCQIEKLCKMTDPLTVLQQSDTGDLRDMEVKERHDKKLQDGEDHLDMAGIFQSLYDILIELNMQEPEDISLDVSTAYNWLLISNDKKTASSSDAQQNRPKTPKTFQKDPQVLSSQSFSSGRHYWEVDVGGSKSWRVGMCYPSIDRRQKSVIGDNDKSWCLYKCEDHYSAIHDSEYILFLDNGSDKIGIYLDYEAGQISFYDMSDPIRHLHTFTATFTEPLHAVLCVWDGCVEIIRGYQQMECTSPKADGNKKIRKRKVLDRLLRR